MKNVWILNHYAKEPGGAGGTRHYGLARHLRKHGWRTSVIASSFELTTGRQRLADRERTRISDFDGVPFLWIRTPQYEGNGGGRMGNMLTYAARVLLPKSTKGLERPDVIVGSSVHPFAAWSGAILAKRWQVPFVFEVRDLWPQTLVDLGRLRERSIVTNVLRKLEKWLYDRADRIVVLLPQADEYIVPLGVPKHKIVWIPNGVELEDYPDPRQPLIHEGFTLMYFGAHGQANGLDCVLKAMAELQRRPEMSHVRLRMIGDGPFKPSLLKLAEELQLANVEFADPVPKREIPTVAAEADAFVFNLIDAPVFNYGISSNKLFDFFAAARPIIFCCKSSNNPVAEAHAGITVPPGEPAALSQAIAMLALMPAGERNQMGRAGRAYVERSHGVDSLAARFANMLNELVKVTEHR